MAYLLDTNALLWVGIDDRLPRPGVREQLFDRIIIAQPLASGLAVATRDRPSSPMTVCKFWKSAP